MKIVNYNKKKTDNFKELETAKNIIKQIYDTKLGALNNAETVFQNVRSSIPELADVPFEVQFPLESRIIIFINSEIKYFINK